LLADIIFSQDFNGYPMISGFFPRFVLAMPGCFLRLLQFPVKEWRMGIGPVDGSAM